MNDFSRPFTVTQLNRYIRELFEYDPFLAGLAIEGELSNFKAHESGHWYFTLKDDKGAVRCVMFREAARRVNFAPSDGARVVLAGCVSVYEKTGAYQFYAEEMRHMGAGSLSAAFEELKRKLEREGLFDAARKRIIPVNPKCVALVTSASGAALRDMINVCRRRDPSVKLVISPCLVQGAEAAQSIKAAIELVNEWGGADVIIVGRGGGSIEDLWAFNEEATARAVAGSRIPVISAVGHETDVTITDFAADLRAPTPSAAAELATGDSSQAARAAAALIKRFSRAVGAYTLNRRQAADSMALTLSRLMARFVNDKTILIDRLADGLNKVSPLAVFERGFGAVSKGGKRVKNINELIVGDNIDIDIYGGRVLADVTCIKERGYATGGVEGESRRDCQF